MDVPNDRGARRAHDGGKQVGLEAVGVDQIGGQANQSLPQACRVVPNRGQRRRPTPSHAPNALPGATVAQDGQGRRHGKDFGFDAEVTGAVQKRAVCRCEQRDVSVGVGAAQAGKGGEQDTFAAAQRTDGIEEDNLHPVGGAAPARSRR